MRRPARAISGPLCHQCVPRQPWHRTAARLRHARHHRARRGYSLAVRPSDVASSRGPSPSPGRADRRDQWLTGSPISPRSSDEAARGARAGRPARSQPLGRDPHRDQRTRPTLRAPCRPLGRPCGSRVRKRSPGGITAASTPPVATVDSGAAGKGEGAGIDTRFRCVRPLVPGTSSCCP